MDKTQQMEKLLNSLSVLTINRINTPQICFSCATKSLDNAIQLKAMIRVTKSKNIFMVPEDLFFKYTKGMLESKLRDYVGDPIVIFVATKTTPLIEGVCTPGPYFNRIRIGQESLVVYWGMPVDKALPAALRMAVLDLNAMLQRFRSPLDGITLRFTYHPKGEGTTSDKVVIWGSPIEG